MRWLPVALALGIGCGHGAPPPVPPHAEGGGPTGTTAVPSAPWSITYADGSGNVYTVHDDGGGAAYTYEPVTPERSSSGTYSGGAPRSGPLAAATTETLWSKVQAFAIATAEHVTERAMMTGSFSIKDASGERSFIVRPSPALTDFDQFLAALP